MKILKYSQKKLKQILAYFSEAVYLCFYDLDLKQFDFVAQKLRVYLDVQSVQSVLVGKNYYFVVFCQLKNETLDILSKELDSLDISEFELSYYQNEQEVINYIKTRGNISSRSKAVYVNKDEVTIQSYGN